MAYFDSDTSESDNTVEHQLKTIQLSSVTTANTSDDGDGNETLKVLEGNNNNTITYDDDNNNDDVIDQDSSNTDVNHHQYDYHNLIHTNNTNNTTNIDDNSCIDLYTLSRSKKPLIDIHTNISFIVHKPVGTICSTIDSTINNRKPSINSRKTIYTIAQESGFPSNLGLVGRLDLETSGIMLFTNDSRLSNAILRPYTSNNSTLEISNTIDASKISPQFNIEMKAKVYLLGLLQGKEPDIYMNEDNTFNILKFENEFGKSFEFSRNCYNIHVNTSKVKFIRRYQHNKYSFGDRDNLGWCIEAYITIYEGKHHQIRRMAIRNKYHTIYLKRIEICNGILNINSIPNPGDCRWLTIDEKIQLYNQFI